MNVANTRQSQTLIGPTHKLLLSTLISSHSTQYPSSHSIHTHSHSPISANPQTPSMAMALQTTLAAAATATASLNSSRALNFTPSRRVGLKFSRKPSRSVVMAATETAETEAPKGFVPPELKPDTPSPIFGGSTGGLLRKAQVEEFYVITWESPKEQIFEMVTGGAAIMREGPNLLKLARKEQCLALGNRLRSKYKINYQFYRVFPNGEVQYLHPKDGVYPEKANAGRKGVGLNMRNIGKNVNPIEVKFTGKQPYEV